MGERLTGADVRKIEAEIEERKLVLRPELIQAVKEARAQGDLSENFEYYAAKREKNRNESRIAYLEAYAAIPRRGASRSSRRSGRRSWDTRSAIWSMSHCPKAATIWKFAPSRRMTATMRFALSEFARGRHEERKLSQSFLK